VFIKLLEPVFDKVFIDKNKEVLICVAVQIVILFAAKGVGYYVQICWYVNAWCKFCKEDAGWFVR